MKRIIFLPVCAVAVLMFSTISFANVINGGFEDGFTGWVTTQPFGNVEVLKSFTFEGGETITANQGDYMAMIGSPSAEANWNMFNQVLQSGVTGRYLSFDYNFWTYDYAPYDNNGLQVMVDGTSVFSLSPALVGKTEEGLRTTGWQHVTFDLVNFLPSLPDLEFGLGAMTLGFMAGDTGDLAFRTGAFIDNVSISPTPLPAAVWLLASGLVGLVGIRNRKFI